MRPRSGALQISPVHQIRPGKSIVYFRFSGYGSPDGPNFSPPDRPPACHGRTPSASPKERSTSRVGQHPARGSEGVDLPAEATAAVDQLSPAPGPHAGAEPEIASALDIACFTRVVHRRPRVSRHCGAGRTIALTAAPGESSRSRAQPDLDACRSKPMLTQGPGRPGRRTRVLVRRWFRVLFGIPPTNELPRPRPNRIAGGCRGSFSGTPGLSKPGTRDQAHDR